MLVLAMAAMTALVAVPALADDKKVDGKKKGDGNTALAANLLQQTNFAEVNGDYNEVLQINAAQQQAAAAAGDNATATNFFGVFVGGNDDTGIVLGDNGNDNGSHGKNGKKDGADNFAACLNAADQYNAAIVDGDFNTVAQANIAQQQCAAAAGDNAFAANDFVVDVEGLGALAAE